MPTRNQNEKFSNIKGKGKVNKMGTGTEVTDPSASKSRVGAAMTG